LARKRFIDPSFWTDIEISKLTPVERLLFIGCFSNADDEGRLPGNPAYLRSVVFPYDDISLDEIRGMRDSIISTCKNMVLYEVDGNEFIALSKWSRYQSPRYSKPSQFPAPPTEPVEKPAVEQVEKPVEESLLNACNQKDASLQPNGCSLSAWDEDVDEDVDVDEDEGMRCASSAADLSYQERECLKALKTVTNYPFDYDKDLDYLRTLFVDFPSVEALNEIKKWCTYKLDHPLKKTSNPRLQLRNWFENAVKWRRRDSVNARAPTGQRNKHFGENKREFDEIDFSKFEYKEPGV